MPLEFGLRSAWNDSEHTSGSPCTALELPSSASGPAPPAHAEPVRAQGGRELLHRDAEEVLRDRALGLLEEVLHVQVVAVLRGEEVDLLHDLEHVQGEVQGLRREARVREVEAVVQVPERSCALLCARIRLHLLCTSASCSDQFVAG